MKPLGGKAAKAFERAVRSGCLAVPKFPAVSRAAVTKSPLRDSSVRRRSQTAATGRDVKPLGFAINEWRARRTAESRRGNRISRNRKSQQLPVRTARFGSAYAVSYGENEFGAAVENRRSAFSVAQGGLHFFLK
jgi:hypothetical protein